MKLAQYYDHEDIRLGMIDGESLLPMDFQGSMIDLIEQGTPVKPKGQALPLEKIRFAPVVSRPSKIIALGLNYLDHAKESKGAIPKVPLLFAKFPNSLAAHKESITWPAEISRKVDFEAELAVIIGKRIYRPQKDQVLKAIFGYSCANDVSARDLQFGDGQWVRGKSLDTFCPIGPWIVTRDDITDPHSLANQDDSQWDDHAGQQHESDDFQNPRSDSLHQPADHTAPRGRDSHRNSPRRGHLP